MSQDDYTALLMCIAQNGYHSVASYQWKKDGENLSNEIFPLLYVSSTGKFECTVSAASQTIRHAFEVKG